MAEAQFVRVTYREIAERFGIGIEGARLKAKRRAEKGLWRIVPGNHPQDIVRVEIPEDEFASGEKPPQRGAPRIKLEPPPTNPPQQESKQNPTRRETNDLDTLVNIISQLTAQLQPMTDRLIEAERAKAEAEKDAAISRASLASAEARMTAMAEAHLSELKALRERLRNIDEQAKTELAEWKARPWWRRLAG